ncbi:hypothetical protein [Neisseria iguanae]|uniref:hypothetical protein n=1 Tax=Neisseria iguanae TaxID=90242 RepID=UPI001475B890|nr:hypothetical protein [Neisseria iguanae]
MGIQPGWAMLSYHKTCRVTACHLAQEAGGVFRGPTGPDGGYFGGRRKGKRGRATAGKAAVSGTLKRQGKVGTAVVGIAGRMPYFRLSNSKQHLTALFIPVVTGAVACLMRGRFAHQRINRSRFFADRQNPIRRIKPPLLRRPGNAKSAKQPFTVSLGGTMATADTAKQYRQPFQTSQV